MKGRPLTDQLTPGAGVFQFIGGDACILVCGRVADTITTGLHRVHLHTGELFQYIGNILQGWPVQLYVLTGRDMGIAFVIVAAH